MPLRILVDPGGYRCRNIGDMAMLEVALARLRKFWPDASIDIISLDPGGVLRIDPEIHPVDANGLLGWNADAVVLGKSAEPSKYAAFVMESCRILRRRNHDGLMKFMGRTALSIKRRDPGLVDLYLAAVRRADLVVMTGGGSLNDVFKRNSFVRLETLELAMEVGAVTAIMGQGIGPVTDLTLTRRLQRILPRVDLIALREGIGSIALFSSLGVRAPAVMVTGDDAVALAYDVRTACTGAALGINLRIATYSGVDQQIAGTVGSVLRDVAATQNTAMLTLPISRFAHEDDLVTGKLLHGSDASVAVTETGPSTPAELLALLPKCRVVVSGSYHAAVFALSMGIPTVTIVGSDYYAHKFRGLADQFGPACRVEMARQPDFATRLRQSVDAAWLEADKVRPQLLTQAVRQIAASKAAYRELFDLVETRRNRVETPVAEKTGFRSERAAAP
jgi:colanic acid/amylovoran biosynthesis protein